MGPARRVRWASRSTLRRDRLVRALAERLPDARLLGVAAGMRVAHLDTYRCRDDAIGPGLVLGYGNLADSQVEEAVARLAAIVAEAVTGPASGPRRR